MIFREVQLLAFGDFLGIISIIKRTSIKKRWPLLYETQVSVINEIGGGGRNQSVKIYTTKRQKSRL